RIRDGFSVCASRFLSMNHEITRYIVTRRKKNPPWNPVAALKLPGEAGRAPARVLALVEAVGFLARLGAVELEVGGTSLARPLLGPIQQRLPHSLRAVLGADRQILDPAALAEADRVDVEIGGAEAEQLAAMLRHQDGRGLIRDGVGDRGTRVIGIPSR